MSDDSTSSFVSVDADPSTLFEDHPMLAYSMATIAAGQNQWQQLQAFVEAGVNPVSTQYKVKKRGSSEESFLCPLIAAAVNGSIESLQVCLKATTRSKIASLRPNGQTLLIRSLRSGSEASVIWLFENIPSLIKNSSEASAFSVTYPDHDNAILFDVADKGMDLPCLTAVRSGAFLACSKTPELDLKHLACVCALNGCSQTLKHLLEQQAVNFHEPLDFQAPFTRSYSYAALASQSLYSILAELTRFRPRSSSCTPLTLAAYAFLGGHLSIIEQSQIQNPNTLQDIQQLSDRIHLASSSRDSFWASSTIQEQCNALCRYNEILQLGACTARLEVALSESQPTPQRPTRRFSL